MPNHVKNQLTFKCSREEMDGVIQSFGVYVPAQLEEAYGDAIICRDADDKFVGWFDLKTGEHWNRGKERTQGLPEGYKLGVVQPWTHFPDFNKILPQPENIYLESVNSKKQAELAEQGIPNWYDWNIENWGTKWNSYSCKKLQWNIYTFETAWSNVMDLMRKLSEMIPAIEFNYHYADEDTGNQVGYATLKNGIAMVTELPNQSNAAYDLALELHPESREYYHFVDGKYQSKET